MFCQKMWIPSYAIPSERQRRTLSSDNARCGVTAGDARFRVNGDNEVLRDWDLKNPSNDPTCFNVDVTDVEELILEVDNNDSETCDFSTWADAMVFKSEEVGKHERK